MLLPTLWPVDCHLSDKSIACVGGVETEDEKSTKKSDGIRCGFLSDLLLLLLIARQTEDERSFGKLKWDMIRRKLETIAIVTEATKRTTSKESFVGRKSFTRFLLIFVFVFYLSFQWSELPGFDGPPGSHRFAAQDALHSGPGVRR